MARIRSIKPELLEDEKTATLSHLEWRLFVSLLLVADDYGNFRAARARIQGVALWAHEDDVGPVLERLASVGLLRLYRVDGQDYGHIAGWSKHQKVDKPGKPLCPGPDKALANDSRPIREPFANDSSLTGTGTGIPIGKGAGPAHAHDPSASEQVEAALEAIPEAIAATIADLEPPAEPEVWTADRWRREFKRAWETANNDAVYGRGAGDAKACSTLAGMLEEFPRKERLSMQEKAPSMLAEFLADRSPKAISEGHQFSYFVLRFNPLRSPKHAATGPPRPAGPTYVRLSRESSS